jgi:hypothetical protein
VKFGSGERKRKPLGKPPSVRHHDDSFEELGVLQLSLLQTFLKRKSKTNVSKLIPL